MLAIILFSVIVLYFFYRGYRLGLGLVLARVVSVVGAYYLAVTFADNGAAIISENSALEGLVAYFIAGFVIFVVSSIIISIILQIALGALGKATDGKSKLPLLGGFANGLLGAFVGLALVWFFNMANTALTNGEMPEDNLINNWSQKIMGDSIDTALSMQFPQAPQLVGIASYVLKNQRRGVKDGMTLANDPDVQTLVNSRKVQRMVQNRDLIGLMTAKEIDDVLEDKTVQRILEETNVLGDIDVTDKIAVKTRLTQEVMTTLVRVEVIKQNPRFKQLTNDPELQRMIRNNDVVGLMSSPKVKEIADIVMDSGIIK
ncbi:CvpA family protein [Colwellia sp. MSW7]|uniref:CvpA family protein n=1 Tax=Colwellia maritima TaxID=2912588 RepID=A0ABS9X5B8_9GAMM|nr:CvpA family protein [Colwellia maritima]MCI2285438.1 CvpA family protein [Colwellia maritima]